jgi:hypothetical protein
MTDPVRTAYGRLVLAALFVVVLVWHLGPWIDAL